MTAFYFNTRDNDGMSRGDSPFEYPTLMDAIEQAKKVLAEMALDGIPDGTGRSLAVEVENASHQPIVTVSIELKVEYPENQPNQSAYRANSSSPDHAHQMTSDDITIPKVRI